MNIYKKINSCILFYVLFCFGQCWSTPTVEVKKNRGAMKDRVSKIMQTYKNPQIIVWFSGCCGLTQRCFDAYIPKADDKNVERLDLGSLLKEKREYNLYLYDLWSWNLLRKKDKKVKASNLYKAFCGQRFKDRKWSLIFSLDFFKWLSEKFKGFDKNSKQNVLLNVCGYDFLWKKSEEKVDCNKKIQDVALLKNLCATCEKIGGRVQGFGTVDCAKIYSILQYLEAFFLIEKIAKEKAQKDAVNIVLLVPEGESNYYSDNDSFEVFKGDVEKFLSKNQQIAKSKITIVFEEFKCIKNPYVYCSRFGDKGLKQKGIKDAFKGAGLLA